MWLSPFVPIMASDEEDSGVCEAQAFGAFAGFCGTEERTEESPSWLVEVEYVHLLLILGSEVTPRVFPRCEMLLCLEGPGGE